MVTINEKKIFETLIEDIYKNTANMAKFKRLCQDTIDGKFSDLNIHNRGCVDTRKHSAPVLEIRGLIPSTSEYSEYKDYVKIHQSDIKRFWRYVMNREYPLDTNTKLLNNQETTMSVLKSIETKLFINGENAEALTTTDLLSYVVETEKEIDKLREIRCESKVVAAKIAKLEKLIKQLVEIIDQKDDLDT